MKESPLRQSVISRFPISLGIQPREPEEIHHVDIYMSPGTIPEQHRCELARILTPLAGMGFMRKDIYADALYQDVSHHVLDCDRLLVSRRGSRASAFAAISLHDGTGELIYHIEGVVVHPDYQGKGLGAEMLKKDIRLIHPNTVAFHTQSTHMLKLAAKLANLNETDSRRVASIINSYQPIGLTDVKRYGTCLYEDIEKFKEIAVPGLDVLNGDALICAGPVKLS